MGEVQLQFPDLDSTLAVSRVEVVSNVEVEAIKGALRWVFDELKKQQAASRLPDTAAMQQQIQDALAITSEQKAAIETLQNQQEQLLQKADKATEQLQALEQSSTTAQGAGPGQKSTTGLQDVTKLQQQLQSLADSQAQLAKEVAALKQSASSSSTTASPVHPSVAPRVPSPSSAGDAPSSNSPIGATSQAVGLPLSPEALSPATGAVGSQVAQGNQQASGLDRQVNALTAEVANLRGDVAALAKERGTAPVASIQGGSSVVNSGAGADQMAPQAPPSAAQSDRLHEETRSKLDELSAALSDLQQRMQGQAATVGDLANAGSELKRLLGDKASLAEVQAVLKAQAGPTSVPVTEGGKVDMADVAAAVNGLGSKLASLEALLALSQQRIADKADLAELDNLRSAINRLKVAVGGESVPTARAGTSTAPDAADVVPAEADSPPRASPPNAGRAGAGVRSGGALPGNALPGNALPGNAPTGGVQLGNAPPSSISARLAILECALPTANRPGQISEMSETPRTTLLTANRGAPASSSSTAASSPADSDLSNRVAALESDFSRLSQRLPSVQMPGATSSSGFSAQPVQLSSTGSEPAQPQRLSLAGPESAQRVQSDAAVLGQLQAQIDAMKITKADKADLEALQLRAAAMPAGASVGNSKSGDSGSLAGLLDTVQKMIAGKADKEELQAVRRLLGDKVNLADHQAAVNNLERSLVVIQAQPANARLTAGSSPAGPKGAAGGSRGAGGFSPVRPGRRTIQDENQVPSGELGVLREEFQQLKAAVEVLTSATHLMAIPAPNRPSSPTAAAAPSEPPGTSEAIISAANPGMAVAPLSSTGATAVADRPTAAAGGSTAAATAVAAIAGLQGAVPPAEGGLGHRGRPVGQSHLVTGLANQKQVTSASEQRGPSEPGAPAATPRARPNQTALPQSTGPASGSPAGLQGSAGLNGSGPLQELMTHMESGQLGHKMNDSDIHDQLAQRLAALERLVRKLTQQLAGGTPNNPQGTPGGAKDRPDERLLRRLGSDLALLKKRVDELAPPKEAGALLMMREGDHAMLAAKPLQGYRCMACDRPLAKLDPDMGGFIPAAPMTVSVAMDVSKNNGIVVTKDGAAKAQGKKGGVTAQQSKTSIFPGPPHTGEDSVGPQNWFKEAHGQPAEGLPREDVGPHLPPGGWRAGAPPSRASPRSPHKASGSSRMAEEEELAAWDSQATVPLPDIHAKSKA